MSTVTALLLCCLAVNALLDSQLFYILCPYNPVNSALNPYF